MSEPQKRHIYIVGGKSRNIPTWLSAAFTFEQFEQDESKTRTLEPDGRPDAVVCLKSWCGHEHWFAARDLAERLGIPLINAPGGWSSAIKAAADVDAEWFIQDIERARRSDELPDAQEQELEDFIDNAWREAYEREYEAREALEKKLGRELKELERLRQKGEAAKRVIAEVRSAAARHRKALDEVQARNERVSAALAAHMESLVALFEATDFSYKAMLAANNRVADARSLAKEKLSVLMASLEIAEGGPPVDSTVSASKAGTDS